MGQRMRHFVLWTTWIYGKSCCGNRSERRARGSRVRFKERDRLLISLVSTEVALAAGIGVRSLNLSFLVAFAVTVALGMRYLGVLLMGSVIINPATVAKRLARSIDGMFAVAVGAALASTLLGTWIAAMVQHPFGPVIVVIVGGLFILSLLKSWGLHFLAHVCPMLWVCFGIIPVRPQWLAAKRLRHVVPSGTGKPFAAIERLGR